MRRADIAQQMFEALLRLCDCPDLNIDELEPESLRAKAHALKVAMKYRELQRKERDSDGQA